MTREASQLGRGGFELPSLTRVRALARLLGDAGEGAGGGPRREGAGRGRAVRAAAHPERVRRLRAPRRLPPRRHLARRAPWPDGYADRDGGRRGGRTPRSGGRVARTPWRAKPDDLRPLRRAAPRPARRMADRPLRAERP